MWNFFLATQMYDAYNAAQLGRIGIDPSRFVDSALSSQDSYNQVGRAFWNQWAENDTRASVFLAGGAGHASSPMAAVAGFGFSFGAMSLTVGGDAGVFLVVDSQLNVALYVSGDMRFGLGAMYGKGVAGFLFPNMPTIDGLNGVTVGVGLDTPLFSVQALKSPTSLVPGAPWHGGVGFGGPAPLGNIYLFGGLGRVVPLYPGGYMPESDRCGYMVSSVDGCF